MARGERCGGTGRIRHYTDLQDWPCEGCPDCRDKLAPDRTPNKSKDCQAVGGGAGGTRERRWVLECVEYDEDGNADVWLVVDAPRAEPGERVTVSDVLAHLFAPFCTSDGSDDPWRAEAQAAVKRWMVGRPVVEPVQPRADGDCPACGVPADVRDRVNRERVALADAEAYLARADSGEVARLKEIAQEAQATARAAGARAEEAEAEVERLRAENERLQAEAAKWEGRARRGVTTPPPELDHLYVRQEQLREACEQRDEAQMDLDDARLTVARAQANSENERRARDLSDRLRLEVESQLEAYRTALERADVALSYMDATPLDDPNVREAHRREAHEAIRDALCGADPNRCRECGRTARDGRPVHRADCPALASLGTGEGDREFYCVVCEQRVSGPCMEPVDMGGGMIDAPCGLEPVEVASVSTEEKKP